MVGSFSSGRADHETAARIPDWPVLNIEKVDRAGILVHENIANGDITMGHLVQLKAGQDLNQAVRDVGTDLRKDCKPAGNNIKPGSPN
jgi:hypothetical protein